MTEDDLQSAFNIFCKGNNQCCAAELFGVPHSCLEQCLQTGQDKPLKNKDRRTISTLEQDLKFFKPREVAPW